MCGLLAVNGAVAGTQSGDDSIAAATDSAPSASPGLAVQAVAEALMAGGGAKVEMPAQADAAGSPGALAVEIMREAQTEAAGAEPMRTTTTTPVVRAAPRANNDQDPWREWGKGAVAWVKEHIPWLRSEEEADRAPQVSGAGPQDWSESPIDLTNAGRGGSDTAAANGVAGVPPGKGALVRRGNGQHTDHDQTPSVVREIIDTAHALLEHPMTWLVGTLVVIGAIAVKKLDRRPTK